MFTKHCTLGPIRQPVGPSLWAATVGGGRGQDIYDQGMGVSQDLAEAAHWLRRYLLPPDFTGQ